MVFHWISWNQQSLAQSQGTVVSFKGLWFSIFSVFVLSLVHLSLSDMTANTAHISVTIQNRTAILLSWYPFFW